MALFACRKKERFGQKVFKILDEIRTSTIFTHQVSALVMRFQL
jgi:hypothetical protein